MAKKAAKKAAVSFEPKFNVVEYIDGTELFSDCGLAWDFFVENYENYSWGSHIIVASDISDILEEYDPNGDLPNDDPPNDGSDYDDWFYLRWRAKKQIQTILKRIDSVRDRLTVARDQIKKKAYLYARDVLEEAVASFVEGEDGRVDFYVDLGT